MRSFEKNKKKSAMDDSLYQTLLLMICGVVFFVLLFMIFVFIEYLWWWCSRYHDNINLSHGCTNCIVLPSTPLKSSSSSRPRRQFSQPNLADVVTKPL